MGGYGSGAWRTSRYRTVERSLVFDVHWFRKRGILEPGCSASGAMNWTWGDDPTGSVGWTSTISKADPANAHLTLRYEARRSDGTRTGVVDSFPLVRTRPNYGGDRWWIRCMCGRRVAKLYLPSGAHYFRCRQCHRLRYRTQRISTDARWERRAKKIVRRLGGEAEDGNVYKPKWMRWATFNRLMDDVQAWNDAAVGYRLRGLLKPNSWFSRATRRLGN